MSLKDKLNAFFYMDEEETENLKEQKQANQLASIKKAYMNGQNQPLVKQSSSVSARRAETNVVSMKHHAPQKSKISIIEPRTYSEVKDIADMILKNNTVILNFRRIEKEQAKKILDFLAGTVYAINGDIQRVGEEIFVCTPSNVDIDGIEINSLLST